jgi:diguanylate cyclase (GGDEF)-like protein
MPTTTPTPGACSTAAPGGPPPTPLSRDDLPFELSANVPSLPAVALEVLEICQDPAGDLSHLARVVSRDPALAARVLRMANSPVYNRGNPVTSVERAAMLLGRRAMKVLALGFSLAAELPRHGVAGGLDLPRVWHRSLLNAVIGRALATTSGSTHGEEVFLSGLFAHLGKLVLSQAMPDAYQHAGQSDGWPTEASERAALGFTSSEVTELLLRDWGVPEVILVGAAYADRIEQLPASVGPDERAVADLTATALLATSLFFAPDTGDRIVRLTEVVADRYGMDHAAIDALAESLQRPLDEMASILDVAVPAGVSYERILESARMQVLAISLDAVMDLASSEVQVAEYARRASTDSLTGLPNRAQFDAFLGRQIDLRMSGPRAGALGVLMIDVDHFKSVNDEHGHVVGDDVLRTMGERLAATTRDSDLLCRYGGEEFCLVLPQTTPETMRGIAERLRREIAALAIPTGGGELHVTASIGGACQDAFGRAEDARTLIDLADRRLYEAKRLGRDRCVVCPDDQPTSSAARR